MKHFELSRRALKDLELICQYISNDSVDAADAVLDDFERPSDNSLNFPECVNGAVI